MKLKDKTAFITGGAKGIGLGCARVFTSHGCKVVIADRDEQAGVAAAKELSAAGRTARFLPCDVTDENQFRAAIDEAAETFGRLDCIVNNAGWHPPAVAIDDISVADFESQLRLNLTSTFMGCKFALPHLRKTRGSIVIIASEVAIIGQALASSYVASKAGQVGLTKALALDLAPQGVRVNAVCPSNVMTPLMKEWAASLENPATALDLAASLQPLGRMASIEEIGEVCAFLASNEASFVTGQALCADGGAALGYRR